ncbi:hypothetical protein BDP55DRAFT_203087 [Colletotrichum godetiae]|uniref:Uncharacterized protein n=1 Tax=Colletotrichum godetiae TaxID=1209918 RepID=A0AAJ0AY86_9PEZI|nr:uncharacterized protein BDP55DRAFT_203087 [Colletotrichum godetiae]KAK1699680.1 hypothetical protein BDP55DRAFT_203087 [Colletotrichum godetiae]
MAPTRACANALRASSSSRLGSVVAPIAATRRCFAAAAAVAANSTFSARVMGQTTTARLGWSATPAAATRTTAAAARFFSSEKERVEDDYHQISANGSKIWDFSQMAELAKDPGNVVIVGMSLLSPPPPPLLLLLLHIPPCGLATLRADP